MLKEGHYILIQGIIQQLYIQYTPNNITFTYIKHQLDGMLRERDKLLRISTPHFEIRRLNRKEKQRF